MINKYYTISNLNNKKIALFSDLHYSKHYDNTIFLKIINNLKQHQPDFICIAGDIIDDVETLKSAILRNGLYQLIKNLSLICKVIIIPGNHDLDKITKKKTIYEYDDDYFENLNHIKNVYYLDNKNIIFGNINFIGLNAGFDYYEKYREKKAIYMLDSIQKIKTKIIKNKYNILLFHSPINILNQEVLNEIEGIDLILSGHMHNGLILNIFDNPKTNIGFVGPFKNVFPKLSKGIKKIEYHNRVINLIISGGIIKLSEHTKLGKFNSMFGIHIEYINI